MSAPCEDRRRRAGFTLVEVLVAITVTGIVALLVYGALDTSIDARSRLEQRATRLSAEASWKQLVASAVRGARPASEADEVVFLLEDGRGAEGLPADRVSFISAGGLPPLTSDAEWQVTLGAAPDGVVMIARPIGVLAPDRRIPAPAGYIGVEIRVRGGAATAAWQDAWMQRTTLPDAIEITFWRIGGTASAPLRIALPR